jgi:putative hemolysin
VVADLWPELSLIAMLIVVNAVLAGSEIALVTLREGQIDRLGKRGGAGRTLSQLARDPNRFLATIQVGITLAGFLASAAAAVSLARPLIEPLSFLGRFAQPTAVVLVTMILAYFSLVFGELAPKRVALQRSEAWSLVVARPLVLLAALTQPIVWLLSKSTDVAVRLMGGDPAVKREELSKDEVRDIVSSRRGFHRVQRTIVAGAFEIAERNLHKIVVSRPRVVAVNVNESVDEAISKLLSSGFSRAPLIGTDLDDTFGVVHLRDLIGKSGTARDHARSALALPESLSVVEALAKMQRERTQLAIVVDEYGGTEGIVTIEDLLEEVVGEIYDEFDRDIKGIQRRSDGSMVVDGEFPIHDLPDVGISLPEGEYATIAGLIMDRLGRIPQRGEHITQSGWRLEVLDVTGRSISKVRLVPPAGDIQSRT